VDYPDFGISGEVPMQPGFATGVMLGTQFHDNIAFEIEGGLLYNSIYQNQLEGISATDMNQITNVQLFQVPMMGNFVFRTDPLANSKIRLLAGGGAGGIFRQVFITGGPNDTTRSQTLSAFQGFGGIQINPGVPDLMVDVQFRYLNSLAGQSVPSMSIMGTVTIRF
jgi:opacity protein-like surface antigen